MSEKKPSKKQPSLARSTGIVSIVTLASRILGMLRDMTIAIFFGAGMVSDAFFLAFTIPNLLRRLVAEGSLSTAFVPVFTDSLESSDDSARKTIKEVTGFSLLITGVLTILGILGAGYLTDFFAPGFSNNESQRQLTIVLTQIMMPYVVIISLIALGAGALNTLGKFALPAAAPAILNIAMISGIFCFSQVFEQPVYGLAIAVPIGGILALIAQTVQLKKIGFPMKIASPFGSQAVKTIALLMIPSIFASSVYQIMVLVNRMLASMLGKGSISWYYFADRLVQFPLGVFSIALATAILPKLSKHASRGEDKEFEQQLLSGLNWVSFIILPASCGLIMLSEPLVKCIYAYGAFSGDDIPKTANALIAFSIGLWSISAHAVLVRGFLAKKNTSIPATISSISIVLNIFLAIAFMGKPISTPESSMAQAIAFIQDNTQLLSLGHIGLALAGSLASLVNFAILSLFLKKLNCKLNWMKFISSSILSLLCTLVMAAALYSVSSTGFGAMLKILIGVPSGAAIYFLAAKLFGSKELNQTISFIKDRRANQAKA